MSVHAEDAAVAEGTGTGTGIGTGIGIGSGNPAEKVSRVITTGNPLRAADGAQPSAVPAGDALTVTRGATLGDTLSNLPDVACSYFGPNSNRTKMRSLDGDRIRMLSNAGTSVDASSLNFDHAVPVDPLVVERIEVQRGAATLLYGVNAIGGVVNTIDNRIPRQAQPGLGGAAEMRLGGPQHERGGAVVRDGGTGAANAGFAWHADVADSRIWHIARQPVAPVPLRRARRAVAPAARQPGQQAGLQRHVGGHSAGSDAAARTVNQLRFLDPVLMAPIKGPGVL